MSTTTLDLNKIMARVRALLDKADSTEFPAEATAFRAKAEEMMREYRIAEESLIASDQVEIQPEVLRIWLGPTTDRTRGTASDTKRGNSRSYYQEWYALLDAAANHAGCVIHYEWGRNEETRESGLIGVVVGYSGDLRLAELVFVNARLVFGERVEPKVNPELSDAVNCYRLRSAGITRRKVAQMLWGEDTHAAHGRVARLYKEECDRRGEKPVLDGRGISASAFRDSFAEAFVEEFRRRLREARDAVDSTGGALVLHGRKERVQERLWQEFPELRPSQEVARTDSASGAKKRKTKPYWQTAAYQRELERKHTGAGAQGRVAGSQAARDVELDRPTPARRVERGNMTLGELLGN